MSEHEYKTIAGRLYADAGVFPLAFAKEYAEQNRARGWYIRLEKLKPPYKKNTKGQDCTTRIWLGSNTNSRNPWVRKRIFERGTGRRIG